MTRNRMKVDALAVQVAPAGSSDSVIAPPVILAVIIRIGAIVFSRRPPVLPV